MIRGNPNYNHKINFEIVYNILDKLETLPVNNFGIDAFSKCGIENEDEFVYYLYRMSEAHFIHLYNDNKADGKTDISYPIITFKGHEYLANLRNDNVMNKVKERVKEVGGSVSLSVVTKIASEIMLRLLFPTSK